jgi:hypothetical protein
MKQRMAIYTKMSWDEMLVQGLMQVGDEVACVHVCVCIFSLTRGFMILVQACNPHCWHGYGSQHAPMPSSLNVARSHGLV